MLPAGVRVYVACGGTDMRKVLMAWQPWCRPLWRLTRIAARFFSFEDNAVTF